uniref:Uncharacterized protein n=1 Tax=Oryza sativa subsp. japonica TaxID=39947 RepID=Q6ZID7_ORYSJ|nr:hypothetical protein [Oryza sativa Japonica Group]
MATSNVDSGVPGRGILVLQDFDEMGLRDGLSDNKLLDDFGCGEIQPVQVHLPIRSEPSSSSTTWSIEINQASSFAAYQKMSDQNIFQEQLSTRVARGRVHRIIENDLDKCRVVAPNLPKKTDDLSHSAGHRWTTREKWSSYDYCLVLDQRCSVSPTTSTLSGQVTTTAWSSTSDVAFLPLLPLQVVELRLLPGPRPAM